MSIQFVTNFYELFHLAASNPYPKDFVEVAESSVASDVDQIGSGAPTPVVLHVHGLENVVVVQTGVPDVPYQDALRQNVLDVLVQSAHNADQPLVPASGQIGVGDPRQMSHP